MDPRLVRRGLSLEKLISETQDIRIHRISKNASEEIGYYRYLSNPHVSESTLLEDIISLLVPHIGGKELLAISDSSDMDYSSHFYRLTPDTGLGHIGNGNGIGYNIHPTLVLDANIYDIYGFSDIQLWQRTQKRKDIETPKYQLSLSDKESYRWLSGCMRSNSVLEAAQSVTYIQDREGDMYDTFVYMKDIPNRHLLIRSAVNRVVKIPSSGQELKLDDYRKTLEIVTTIEVEVRENCPYSKDIEKKRSARKAKVQIRYGSIELQRSKSIQFAYQKYYPESLKANVVFVDECPETVPEGEKPISWRLLTTHDIFDKEKAILLVYWYSLRWWIELLFRLLKKDGYNLEVSELETGWSLRKLGLITMKTAIKVLQLKQAREGNTELPIETVFSEAEIDCLEAILPKIEGNTEKQKNPFLSKTLPWATWIIARLGGWKGYDNKYRPPGVLLLRNGLEKFNVIFTGFMLTRQTCV